jgi:hypothetical protein
MGSSGTLEVCELRAKRSKTIKIFQKKSKNEKIAFAQC